jgi:hyperosmotically inducible periplasmic protein
MHITLRTATKLPVFLLLGAGLMLPAAQKGGQADSPAADNTKTSKSEPTADQAKNNAADRELMQKIRQAIMDDNSLSTYAHNVKVIAQNGKVTLKGPVRTAEEKKIIEQKAAEVAGPGNVVNKITVKPETKT